MLINYHPYDPITRTEVVLSLTNSAVDQTSNSTALAADTKPTTVSDYMLFTGTQNVRFSDKDLWHVTSPYSVVMEVYIDERAGPRWIATVGEGFGLGWPEWSIVHDGASITFRSSNNNNGITSSGTFVSNFNPKQWYQIGLMFLNGRAYGYVNEVQVFNVECSEPINTTNGLAVGGDYRKYANYQFKGRIRNFKLGKSAFWTV